MADGEVKINAKLDSSELDKGLKNMKGKLDNAGKSIDNGSKKTEGLNKSFKGLNAGVLKAAGGFALAAKAIKKTVDVLNDCAAAYEVQRKAETALQVAAKNNPYLNEESVQNLKNFASQLQSMSEIGDEVSLKVMSQLAATGRNEEQIMQIMGAAADMAAVTGNSLQNTALQLNKTYSGLAGELGEANGAIRALTKEELESGKAIEIVAKQYNGAASEMADETVQLKNAWGDLKESIGKGWKEATAPAKKEMAELLKQINDVNAYKEQNKGLNQNATGTAEEKINQYTDKIEYYKDSIKELKELREQYGDEDLFYSTQIREAEAAIKQLNKEIGVVKAQAGISTNKRTREKAEADEQTAAQKAADRNRQATDYIIANKDALNDQIKALELKAAVEGKTVDAQEIYNAYLQSYIDLVTKSNGLVTENNAAAETRLVQLKEKAQAAKDAAEAEKELKEMESEIEKLAAGNKTGDSALDQYTDRQNELLKMKDYLNREEIKQREDTAEKLEAIDEELSQNRRNLWSGLTQEISGYANQTAEIIQNSAALALETEKNRMQAELDNLEIKYRKGELGEEEYQEKVAEAKKKGAETQYKIEMAQWGANILSATANTAVGVTKALAEGGVAGTITGALVAAAGAVQLASIMASKPTRHYESGGFIGGMNGASLGADNTVINARTGELVVNAAQQRNLWDALNGSGALPGSAGFEVVINNSASNLVTATPQINKNQIELMIDARVNDGLRKGRYNDGLNIAQAGMSGEFYGT